MKRMIRKDFLNKYVYSFKNLTLKCWKNEIEFCPAHNLFDFKLPYKFPCIFFYDKKKDATVLFFHCAGIINLDFCADSYEGIMMRFQGNKTDNLLDDLLKSKKFTNLLTDEYNKYESELRERSVSEEKEETEEVHKTFENFEEELKKVEESMGA